MSEESVIRKVRALLELNTGNGATEAEASVAAARAQELLLRYNLSLSDCEAKTGAVGLFVAFESNGKNPAHWRNSLLGWVGAAYFAQAFTYSRPSVKYCFVGRESNAKVACEMFAYLSEVVFRVSLEELNGRGAAYLDSFRKGMVSRLGQRLRDARRQFVETSAQGTALRLLTAEEKVKMEAEQYYQSAGMKTKAFTIPGASCREAQAAGRAAAEKVNLSDQLGAGRRAQGELG
jgi:hypothetical protein